MKLYDIPTEIRALLDTATVDEETGEISFDEEAYERVTGDAKVKIANTARFLREEDAEIAAMKQVLANIKSRLDAKKRRYEYLQDLCLRAVMEVGKVEEPDIRVSTRRHEAVIVEDTDRLPPEFVVTTTTTAPNKISLKSALKSGREIEGCHLEERQYLMIK